jgi:hypothetical protein
MPLTREALEAVVHVAGPVENEKIGTRRVRRQRCLRCDVLLRDERERLSFWLLGQRISIDSEGWSRLVEREQLSENEKPCRAPAL